LDVEHNTFGGKLYTYYIAVNIFGWLTQFVGHGIYEQRAPAITTNLFFMFIAPFFDVFEVMNMVYGYKDKEIKEYAKIIDADIAHYRLSRGMKMRPGI